MFGGINKEDLSPELRERLCKAERSIQGAVDEGVVVMGEVEAFMRAKVQGDECIAEYELNNAFNPVAAFCSGYRPAVVPFEVRGGENDGKRLITLCVILADEKTVMPVLQVPDFAVIEMAEYVGSMEDLEVILPEDGLGRDWQKTIAETVKQYVTIHGGEDLS